MAIRRGWVIAPLAEMGRPPPWSVAAPQFVESFLGLVNGNPGEMNIGALPVIYNLGIGIPYMRGGLLFGIATLRAGILPRWAAGLLAVAATLTPAAALLPHDIQRLAAIPVGLALAWLGYALWSLRREQAADLDDGVLTGVDQPAVVPSNGHSVPSKV
jgi:hypothetical protein